MLFKRKKSIVEFYRFMQAENNAIETSKYIESQKARRDLYFDERGYISQEFYIWWIRTFAEDFRKAWPRSLCKTCTMVMTCKDCLKEKCSEYAEEPKPGILIELKKRTTYLKELLCMRKKIAYLA